MKDPEKEKARKRRWWRKRWGDPAFQERERERLKLLARSIRAKARELNERRAGK